MSMGPSKRHRSRLRTLRRAAHLTQKQLAAQVGATYQTIQKWERGELAVPPARRSALAMLLGVRPDQLRDTTRRRPRPLRAKATRAPSWDDEK
jgi:transcriptional regulator with XRE-family HTH domain